jgi:hypothetical protein
LGELALGELALDDDFTAGNTLATALATALADTVEALGEVAEALGDAVADPAVTPSAAAGRTRIAWPECDRSALRGIDTGCGAAKASSKTEPQLAQYGTPAVRSLPQSWQTGLCDGRGVWPNSVES